MSFCSPRRERTHLPVTSIAFAIDVSKATAIECCHNNIWLNSIAHRPHCHCTSTHTPALHAGTASVHKNTCGQKT